jgi:MurNAc alpha-1-phosphate uridylyltransferase
VAPGAYAKLGPLLFASAGQGRLAGRVWDGAWHNVGTPEQLAALNAA